MDVCFLLFFGCNVDEHFQYLSLMIGHNPKRMFSLEQAHCIVLCGSFSMSGVDLKQIHQGSNRVLLWSMHLDNVGKVS
jgi:hypothetical protein